MRRLLEVVLVAALAGAGFLWVPIDRDCRAATWLAGPWGYRQRLVLNRELRAAPLDDYPALVRFTPANTDFWSHLETPGLDIRFADCGGHPLSHEIDTFDAAAKAMSVWVRLRGVGAGGRADCIFMYYGNSKPGDPPAAQDTWDPHYKLVMHMNHLRSTADGVIVPDSSAGHHDGSFKPVVAAALDATGVFGSALQFDGAQSLWIGDHADWSLGGGDWTLEFWLRVAAPGTRNMGLLTHGPPGVFSLYRHMTNFLVLEASNDGLVSDTSFGQARIAPDAWTLVTLIRHGDQLQAWVDLQHFDRAKPLTGFVVPDTPDPLLIGTGAYGGLTGWIDELRLSKGVARPTEWIQASLLASHGVLLAVSGLEEQRGIR